MPIKYADVRFELTISFEDDGETDILSQAIDAAREIDAGKLYLEADIEVIGPVRDTEILTGQCIAGRI